jgi:Ca2+-binding RTX toxin-like protein
MSGHQDLFFGSSTDNDKINGGPGNDYLIGGVGSDTFEFAPNFGKDVIADFQPTGAGHDVIQIDHTVLPDFQAVLSHMAQAGGNVVITADAHDTIQIENTSKAHLNSDDFHFV